MKKSYKNIAFALLFAFAFSSETYTINAGNFYYSPSILNIEVGDMVEFINDGGFHDVEVTSGPELFELPACSGPCTIGTLTFDVEGTYEYICSIGSHASNGMVGTIVVDNDNDFSSASLQIIHNSASPTVDVYVDGELLLEGFEYRTATPVLEVGTSFTVGIAPTGGDVIADFPFTLEDGGEYVVVATGILGNEDTPFTLAPSGTTFGATDGNVGLNVYHGSTDAPSVDILADGGVLVEDLMYGEFSGYVEVPASDYIIGIAPTGGEAIVEYSASLSGLGGGSAVVFASGLLSGDDPAFGVFAALEDGMVLELESLELSINANYDVEPSTHLLNSIFPNPFNPVTTISYNITSIANVNISIHDINGRFVQNLINETKIPGNFSITWYAKNLPSGIYFINMNTESYSTTKKVILAK